MKTPVTIDPRRHDAVIFDLDGVVTDTASMPGAGRKSVFDSTVELVRRLAAAGVRTALCSSNGDSEHVVRLAGLGDLFTDGPTADPLGLSGAPDPAAK
ncbi:hypothetical protein BHQ17_26825 [Mycolicibacterium holsaticum]|uniref:Haloacid dehalogenase n=1 Tax=Mycolicibacterium holsaticum TaxID=152142 RepID=A0A1E3R403_9MYCO|nr:hypothetical protein BHQ17_26825 [Mycolicibacterium holsaticum]